MLSDEDFLQDGAEEQVAPVLQVKEEEEEWNFDSSVFLKGGFPSNDSKSLSIWEENKTASNEDSSMKHPGEECIAESVCDRSKPSSSDWCDVGMTTDSQNYVLPASSCKTEVTEIDKTSDRRECDGAGGFQTIPPLLSSAGSDETIETSRLLALAAISRHEEELVSAASVPSDGSQENQPEIHKEMETIAEMEGKWLIRLFEEF